MSTIAPGQDDVLALLRSFLAVVPACNAFVATENRVPEPSAYDFAVMSPIGFKRLATNSSTYQDVKFTGAITSESVAITGSIAPAAPIVGQNPSGVLTVTQAAAAIAVGADVTGQGVAPGTYITGQLSGTPGGAGTYSVNESQNLLSGALTVSWGAMAVSAVSFGTLLAGASVFGVNVAASSVIRVAAAGGGTGNYVVSPAQTVASETLSSGAKVIQQNAQITVQVDFHSQTGNGADMAQAFSTAFRDPFAVDFFSSSNANIAPFYADDPRLAPFQNENQQYEYRWIVDAQMQVNQTIVVPQQFADALSVTLIDVDSKYPPT